MARGESGRTGRSADDGGNFSPGGSGHRNGQARSIEVTPSPSERASLSKAQGTEVEHVQNVAERRRHRRIAWQRREPDELVLEVEGQDSDWRRVPFTMVDLAQGGLGMLVAEPLEPGARVRVTFPLPPSLEEPVPGEAQLIEPWSALAEVVHARQVTPPEGRTPEHVHLPQPSPHLPHHRGARFAALEGDAEMRLLRALYGQLPAGWAVEQYRIRRPGSASEGDTSPRYAVIRDGKRVAWGFGSYEKARSRAMSMHLDSVAEQRRKAKHEGGTR